MFRFLLDLLLLGDRKIPPYFIFSEIKFAYNVIRCPHIFALKYV
jgi:hypothetical protein